MEGLPAMAIQLLTSPEYAGGLLVTVGGDEDAEADSADLDRNFAILRAVTRACPTHVPSGFLVADAFLVANELFDQTLLKVPACDDHANNIRTLALAHGSLVRRLSQRLRLLFRGSPDGAHSWKIMELKQLCKSKDFRRPSVPDIPDSWSPIKAIQDEDRSNEKHWQICARFVKVWRVLERLVFKAFLLPKLGHRLSKRIYAMVYLDAFSAYASAGEHAQLAAEPQSRA